MLAALSLLAAACGGDDDATDAVGDIEDEVSDLSPDVTDDDGATTEADGEPAVEEQSFEIDVETVKVGAFVIDFESVEVTVDEFDAVTISLPFRAENLHDELATPIQRQTSGGVVLDVGGEFLTSASIDANEVPGGRTGEGTLSFSADPEIDLSDLDSAILTLGTSSQNQVVVALDGSELVALHDVDVDVDFSGAAANTDFEVGSGWIEFSARAGDDFYDAGTAVLVLPIVISAGPDMGGAGLHWGGDDVALLRPGGISVTADGLNEAIYPGDRQEPILQFELEDPLDGEYELTFSNRDEQTVGTFTVTIPS